MPGQLFTQYFLTDGIRVTPEWKASLDNPGAFESFKVAATGLYNRFNAFNEPNEAVTEQQLIIPILEAIGWDHYMPQQGAQRNEDIPDHLLFHDAAAKETAAGRSSSHERFLDALLVEESKRFGLHLDNREVIGQTSTPHGQILRYLTTAEVASEGRIRWGILTNGDSWRLYDYKARPRSTGYFEANLGDILGLDDPDYGLRLFYLLFRRQSFTPQEGAADSFLDYALAEGKRYEQRVAGDLSRVVFDEVFPWLVDALAVGPEDNLMEVRDAALVFLYRLFFILYAEDRGLLPVNDPRYDNYGLRKPVRDHIAERMKRDDVFSSTASNYYDHLTNLFRLIDRGDVSIGLPPYNGGLFSSEAAPLLGRVRLPDNIVARVVYELSHTRMEEMGEIFRRFVNYRDMSVQQLGSIYERLLERQPVRNDFGEITIQPNPYARKDSGSFYTPQELVDLIVERTLKPLSEERLQTFERKSQSLARDRRPKAVRHAELRELDPAEAVLDLKVLDPAMGSGHFLVTAVDFLSDYIAHLVECVPAVPEWLDGGYVSPLLERVEAIRQDILQRARDSNWIVDESQLSDQAIIRRMVLKRCIYGVDKNPMTVELAKVSLWLHSFTVGAPLSFLDHHLRCGDSLLGMSVAEGTQELRRLAGLSAQSAISGAEQATEGMQRIEEMSDSDVAEVQESSTLFRGVEDTTAELRGLLDFLHGLRWQTAGKTRRSRAEFESPLVEALEQRPADAYQLLASGPRAEEELSEGFQNIWTRSKSIAGREGFLHWEVAFPGVWRNWQDIRPSGGFDAVIGNPPWDRIKLEEVEWFKIRDLAVASATTDAERKIRIQLLRDQRSPLVDEFDAAKEWATKLGKLIRKSGHYPLLGGGDVNLYSLFVERAMNLVKPDGFVGLLTPSGIYADKTAADFFKSVSTTGRVGGLFDFENRRLETGLPPYFPDVDSRFKFCTLIFGREERSFPETEFAFFLHDTETIRDSDRCFPLEPEDFARVNPNTATAPVFRTRRDAEITRYIYENHPVLVKHSLGQDGKAWPVRYHTMFHMTNDSGLFRTAERLDAEGYYPVGGNRWQKGEELYLPLFEGKMVQAFDHRAASVVINPENLHRPAQPEPATIGQHQDPAWLPTHLYWVPASECEWPPGLNWVLGFKEITAPTNARTFIATLMPAVGFGNKIPILKPETTDRQEWLLAANLNAMVFDFVTRQKIQGQTLNLFIVEQLPVIPDEAYDRPFGMRTARATVRDHVLRLTYTAHDMAPFARDLGFDGPPFIWNEEERRHLRARLDALYFHLYGISREDAAYILDTFPIIRRQDMKEFKKYRTKEMVLAYMNALAAGDTETDVAV